MDRYTWSIQYYETNVNEPLLMKEEAIVSPVFFLFTQNTVQYCAYKNQSMHIYPLNERQSTVYCVIQYVSQYSIL